MQSPLCLLGLDLQTQASTGLTRGVEWDELCGGIDFASIESLKDLWRVVDEVTR